jgi:hypothetical protein
MRAPEGPNERDSAGSYFLFPVYIKRRRNRIRTQDGVRIARSALRLGFSLVASKTRHDTTRHNTTRKTMIINRLFHLLLKPLSLGQDRERKRKNFAPRRGVLVAQHNRHEPSFTDIDVLVPSRCGATLKIVCVPTPLVTKGYSNWRSIGTLRLCTALVGDAQHIKNG